MKATLYLCQLRDSDGAVASLKAPLDALKQKQIGQYGKPPKLGWRSGICPTWGFYVDDSPDMLTLAVEQIKVGKRAEERLVVEIAPV